MKNITKQKIKEIVKGSGAYLDFEKFEVLLHPLNGANFVYSYCKYTQNFEEVWETIERYDWKIRFDRQKEYINVI